MEGDNYLECLITDELISKEYPQFKENTWFATGMHGVVPRSAVKKLTETMFNYETELFFRYGEIESKTGVLREKIASLISANTSEICFTRNANEGITIALSNIDFKPGDEIITSNQEHGALMGKLRYIERRVNANLKVFDVHKEPEENLEAIKNQITDKTKAFAFSHVTCETGIRLPVKEICKIAREIGAYILLDGAQTVGDISVNVQDYDCDFYVGNGHKWLCAPKGTSFLYVNSKTKCEPPPGFLGLCPFCEDPLARTDAGRFEFGTRDCMLLYGFLVTIELYEEWGWQMKDGRIKDLTSYLRENLSTIPKCIVHSPIEWEKSSGNTTFSMKGYSLGELSSYLSKEWHIYTRGVVEVDGTRISTSFFNTYKEIDKLIKALKSM